MSTIIFIGCFAAYISGLTTIMDAKQKTTVRWTKFKGIQLRLAMHALRQIAKPKTPGDVCAIDPQTLAAATLARIKLQR